MGNETAHLEMIQAVVNRMSVNSFLLKGWSVVLVSALFALAAAQAKIVFVYVACFPAVAFWLLDGYFLRQERLFRALYDHVRAIGEDEVDFSMDTASVGASVASWGRVVFSLTLIIFHGAVLASIVAVAAIVG